MLMDLVQGIINGIGSLGNLISNLPLSPFQSFFAIIDDAEVMGIWNYINWFIPVSSMAALLNIWLTSVAMYYAIKVPLRWAKVVKS